MIRRITAITRSGSLLLACAAWLGCTPSGELDDTGDCDPSTCVASSDAGAMPSTGPAPGGSSDGAEAEGGELGGEADGGGVSTGLPCAVLDVLRRECLECHDDPPTFGALMPLADYGDLQVPASTDPTRPVHALVAERLLDDTRPMPPGAAIEPADRQILLDWIEAGAPEDPSSECGEAPPDDGPEVGPDALPCEPDVEFLAHDPLDADAPFELAA
jgi:hypothetical protein